MSSVVDSRVVSMEFDNKNFEQGARESMNTIDKLKMALNFSGIGKGIEEVSGKVSNFSMSSMESGIQSVTEKFDALKIIGTRALQNITDSVMNTGKKMINALTIDPVKTGLEEYETKINSVQTIMSNTRDKGTTIDDVTDVLNELNTYSDKTIYNFAEMTRNIGTFTAAGVGLEESADAIRGIANLAAQSGSNSQQASTAMYQLSQALAAGSVKLQDWNSVVNAGMGGQLFQNKLKETATQMGINVDAMIEKNGSFRESLQEGWITSEVLLNTLRQFSPEGLDKLEKSGFKVSEAMRENAMDAENAATKVKTFTQLIDTLKESVQSNWSQSWELIIGNFEEAKELWTAVSDTLGGIIGEVGENQTNLLKGWRDLGGRQSIIDGVVQAFQALCNIMKPVKEAFVEIFPPLTAQQLVDFSNNFKNLMTQFNNSTKQIDGFKDTLKGIFSIFDIFKMTVSAVGGGIAKLAGHFLGMSGGLLEFTGVIGKGITEFHDMLKSTNIIGNSIYAFVNILCSGMDGVKNVIDSVVSSIKKFLTSLNLNININPLESLNNILSNVGIHLENLVTSFRNIGKEGSDSVNLINKSFDGSILGNTITLLVSGFIKLWDVVKKVGGSIIDIVGKIATNIADIFDSNTFNSLLDGLNSIALLSFFKQLSEGTDGLFDSLKKAIDIFSPFKKSMSDGMGGITGILNRVKDSLGQWQESLKGDTLLKIAGAIGILAASLTVLASIPSDRLTEALTSIAGLFAGLMGSLSIFSKITAGVNVRAMTKVTGSLTAIAVAVLLLASAMKTISSIDTENMKTSLLAVSVLIGEMTIVATTLSKNTGKMMKGAGGLLAFAAAINVLANVCVKMAGIDANGLIKGLVGVGTIMAEIAAFSKLVNKSGINMNFAVSMTILSTGLLVLAGAVDKMGSMSSSEIIKGLSGIGAVMVELIGFSKLIGNNKGLLGTSTAIVVLSSAMLILAKAVGSFGSYDWSTIGKGLTAMAGSLIIVAGAMKLLPRNTITTAAGVVIMAEALKIMAQATNSFGSMNWSSVATGLTAMAGSMVILAVGVNAMNGCLTGAAAMIVISAALNLLAPVLVTLGNMTWDQIGKGLLTLAGAFSVLGVAGLVLTPLVPTILGLSGAIALLGVGILAIGAGVTACGVGLSALAAGLIALGASVAGTATTIVAGLGVIIAGILEMIPEIVVSLINGIKQMFIALGEALPQILIAVGKCLDSILVLLIEYIPKIVIAVLKILKDVLAALASNIGEITALAVKCIVEFVDGLRSGIGDIIDVGCDLVVAIIEGLVLKIPDLVNTALELVIAFINGFANAIDQNGDKIVDAIINLIGSLFTLILDLLAGIPKLFSEIGSRIMDSGLLQGIASGFQSVLAKCGEIKDSLVQKFMDIKDRFVEVGHHIVTGIIEGIQGMISSVAATAQNLANTVVGTAKSVLGIHSPSRVFRDEVGAQLGAGMAWGIEKSTPKATKAAKTMADKVKESAQKEFDNFKTWLSDKKYFNELSLEEEQYAWEEAAKRYAQYSDMKKEIDKELYRIKNELIEEHYKRSMDWISDQKDYDLMTTEQEIAAYERMQSQYEQGTEKRKTIDKELYKLRKQLKEEDYDRSMQYIEDEEFYERMNSKQKLEALKHVQSKWEEGTEKRKQLDKEVWKLEKEIQEDEENFVKRRAQINSDYNTKRMQLEQEYADKVKSINDKLKQDIQSVNNEYENAVKSRTDSIRNAFSLFSAADLGEEVDSTSLISNLQSQVDAIQEWRDNLDSLQSKGVNTELLSELQEAGPSSLNNLKAMNNLSAEELDQFVFLWQEKTRLANERATQELEDLRIESDKKIQQLTIDAETELANYRATWQQSMDDLKTETMTSMNELMAEWTKKLGESLAQQGEVNAEMVDSAGKAGLDSMKTQAKAIDENASKPVNSVAKVMNKVVNTMNNELDEFYMIGKQVMNGLMQGLESKRDDLMSLVHDIAQDITDTMQEALDIHSPSRVMKQIGVYTMSGLEEGMLSYSRYVYNASDEIAVKMTDKLNNIGEKIDDSMWNNLETTPIITPVLDLSNIESGIVSMNDMFDDSIILSTPNKIVSKLNNNLEGIDHSNNAKIINNNYTFTQHNTSPKTLNEIEVYRQSKNLFSTLKKG